jgi:hypothetical protein
VKTLVDTYNDDRTGRAVFSEDMEMRFLLERSLPGFGPLGMSSLSDRRVVFLMLNPSDADAFKPDPTVTECVIRAIALGGEVLQVVNLFAFRSPYPSDLLKRAAGMRGNDADNNAMILHACIGASIVVAAWGNNGAIAGRDVIVLRMLADAGVELHHLGMTNSGHPKHPLARGKHRIPRDLAPVRWI